MKKRIISYAKSLEDVILYHVLKDEGELFYIDCGANDEANLSVTKFLNDEGIAV